MIVNPYSNSIDMGMVTQTFSRKDPRDVFASEAKTILKRYEMIRETAVNPKNVQISLLDVVPSYSMYIFPREKDGGKAFVQVYAYRAPEYATPYFVISQTEHPIWYKNFCDLYEIMWQDAANYFSESDY